MIAVAIAVIEDGHATYAVGELTAAQLMSHFSKIDLAIGTHLREYEGVRTETMLEKMEASGVLIYKETPPDYSTRYYQKELTYRMTSKAEAVRETLRTYLQQNGFTVERHETPLHVRHLERMRHRTGYMAKEDE